MNGRAGDIVPASRRVQTHGVPM